MKVGRQQGALRPAVPLNLSRLVDTLDGLVA